MEISKALQADSPDTLPVVTVVAAPTHVARAEVQVVRAARVARAERTGPVEAARTSAVQARIAAIARSRQENTCTSLYQSPQFFHT